MWLVIPILMIVGFLMIVGCSNKVNTDDVDKEFPPSMNGRIIINDTEYLMESGGYKWERKKGLETEVVQTDHASPYQMAAHIEPIVITPNQTIDIQIEGNPKINVYLWNEKGREREIEQKPNQIILPSSQGKYIYEVLAEWTSGTISYTFVVEIK